MKEELWERSGNIEGEERNENKGKGGNSEVWGGGLYRNAKGKGRKKIEVKERTKVDDWWECVGGVGGGGGSS